jgi:hypothetical protein
LQHSLQQTLHLNASAAGFESQRGFQLLTVMLQYRFN